MSETLALLRIALAKSRFLLMTMVGALVIGEFIALLAMPIQREVAGYLAFSALYLTLVAAGFASIVLFDYGDYGDMNLPESGCSHWLLRMPVHAWKIAIVPVILKTAWISGLWLLVALTARYLGAGEEFQVFAPCIGLSAIAIWILVIAWRPFRSGWRRLAGLIVAAPVLYCCVGAVFVAPYINQAEWRPIAIVASIAFAIAMYISGVYVAIRSVELARISSTGIIPEFGNDVAGSSDPDEYSVRQYKSARHALIHHDWIKQQGLIRKMFVVAVIPTIIGFSLFAPLHVVTVVLVLVLFAEFCAVTVCGAGNTANKPQTMPPYLVASPLRTSTIAWTRLLTLLAAMTGVYLCVVFVFAGWACWPENRETWSQWAADRAASLDAAADATTIGIGWSVAIVFGWGVLFVSRIASYVWVGFADRTWLTLLTPVVAGLAYLVPVGVGLRWFMVQTDWETTKASALSYLTLVPAIIAGSLALKGLAVATSVVAVSRRNLASRSDILRVIAIWAALTLSIALILCLLIPDPRATFLLCLATTSLVIPLSRVIILPLALAWNRHR